LVLGRWDIQVPPAEAPEVLPDVLLVPLLAFDREGFRLGYGGGFYDRTLEKLRALKEVTAIGIAYAGQEMDTVPRDEFDQRLDWIMTEKETFKCG
jgi:5-formyltetrahydrofolate cyclo-ligase